MGEVDEVQEKMKADMEAMKEQMATMMEAIINMKKIREVDMVAVAFCSTFSLFKYIQGKSGFPESALDCQVFKN